MSNELRGSFDPLNLWLRTGEVTAFGEQSTAEFSPLIELDSSNGLSTVRRDEVTTANTGTVTNTNGEHVLATGTTASSTAELGTKERGRYQPGITGLPGIAFRLSQAPTGDMDGFAGYYDDTDGVWVGQDSTGIYIQYRHNSTTEDKVYQSAWNGTDRLDGNGPSGVTLDLTQGNVFRFPFVWYFGGPIIVKCQTMNSDGRPVYAELHRIVGPRDEPILSNPKLPVVAKVQNGTTEADFKMYVGGRQFAVLGRYNPNRRTVPENRDTVSIAGDATEPLISFRKKSARISTSKSVKVQAASVLSDSNGRLKIYLDPELTGASWGSVSEVADSETAVESDISATAISGGTLIRSMMVSSANGGSFNAVGIEDMGQDLPDGTIVTLAFEDLSGTTAEVDASFSCREEW